MATSPATSTPQRKNRIPALVSMVNQVVLEGYLVRAWIHEPYRYLRLANQRPPEHGGQTGGRVPIESDYVTVRLDPSVPFDMQRATRGQCLLVRGRMEGRDIPETIGEILAHCKIHIELPLEIAAIQVSRPAVQICCTTLEFHFPHHAGNREAGSHRNRDRGREYEAVTELSPIDTEAAQSSAPPGTQALPANPKDGLQPGEDAAETATQLDTKKSASKNVTDPAPEKKPLEKLDKKSKIKKK
jgi:hypothetical protein